jgi:outer membrane immunogenic protein
MNRFTVGLFLALASTQAIAADLALPSPAVRVFNWTGIYIGANTGYGQVNGDAIETASGGLLNGLTVTSSGNANGAVAGGQVGYNYQTGVFVSGVEADYQWSGQSKANSVGCGIGCTVQEKTSLTSFGTLRGRFGIAADRILIYATGGAAYLTGSNVTTVNVGIASAPLLSVSLSGIGWTAGGGIEAAISDNWSLKAEYLYLASSNVTGTGSLPTLFGGTATESIRLHDQIGRVGINYRF